MNHKQRFIQTLCHRQPEDMVAMMELEFQIHEEYMGESAILGENYKKLSIKEKERALYKNAELFIRTAEKAGHDVIRGINAYWEISPGIPAYWWLPSEEDCINQIRAIKEIAGNDFFIAGTVGGMIGTIPDGNSIYSFVDELYENPEGVHKNAEKKLNDLIDLSLKYIDAGADGLVNASDLAIGNNTFLSPIQLDEFFFPYFNRWVNIIKKAGSYSILHSDGNINGIMDQILASGVDAIQCVDPLAHMDIVSLKKQVEGKLTLIGNVDCSLLMTGNAEEIENTCKYVLDNCKYGGGYVFGGCNAIFKGIPPENYQVLVDSRKKYGSF